MLLNRPGRKELTTERKAAILDGFRNGYSLEATAAKAGVSRRWLYNKLNEDEDFRVECETQEGFYEASLQEEIRSAGASSEKRPNWTANAWLLERKYARWRERRGVDVTKIEDDQLLRLIEEYQSAVTASDTGSRKKRSDSGEGETPVAGYMGKDRPPDQIQIPDRVLSNGRQH